MAEDTDFQPPVRRGGRQPRNVSEPESLRASAKEEAKKQAIVEAELRELLANAAFRRYVWRWMDRLQMWSDSIPLNSELYVKAAERRVALRMWREIEDVNPAALLQMMQDGKNKEMY